MKRMFGFSKGHFFVAYLFCCFTSFFAKGQELNLDNISEIKQMYADRDWFKADSVFNAQVKLVEDSLLKERVMLDWGTFMVKNNDYDWAEAPLLATVALAQYNNSLQSEAESYYQLGRLYYLLEIPVQAQQYFLDALEIFESMSDSLGIGQCYDGLADNYNNMGDFENAYEYYYKADTLFNTINEPALRSNILGNIANMLIIEGHADSGLAYIDQALTIDREIANSSNMVNHTASLAFYHEEIGDLDKAYDYYISAQKMALGGEDEIDLGFTNQHLGYYHYYYGSQDSAKHYMLACLDIAQRKSNAQLMSSSSNLLSEIYADEGDFKQAYTYKNYYANAADTLFSEQNILGMASMKSKYAVAKSESEKELLMSNAELAKIQLENQKITNYFLGFAAFIFLLAFGWVLYYAQQRRKLNLQLRDDKKIIEDQTNRLKDLDQYKSRFFANVTHDFRSPLMLIKGYIDILRKEDNQLTDNSVQALGYISTSVERLNDMTDEIRDLVRLEENRVTLKYAPIQVDAFFKVLGEMFYSAAAARGLKLNFQSDLGPNEIIHADKYALEKIIFNLVENAIKYNTTGTKVDFKVNAITEGVQVSIIDDGPGIDEEQLPMIFERYYQSGAKTHKGIEGQGIGLNVVKQYVELHGGSITVSSAPYEETTFSFVLPLNLDKMLHEEEVVGDALDRQLKRILEKRMIAINPASSDTASKPWESGIVEPSRKMILVLENHAGIRQMINETLSEDYLVLEATTGEEGTYILKSTQGISLIIVDMELDGLSTQDLMNQLASQELARDIPIIAMSEDSSLSPVLSSEINQKISIISKPLVKSELIAEVDQLLTTTG